MSSMSYPRLLNNLKDQRASLEINDAFATILLTDPIWMSPLPCAWSVTVENADHLWRVSRTKAFGPLKFEEMSEAF